MHYVCSRFEFLPVSAGAWTKYTAVANRTVVNTTTMVRQMPK